MYVLLCVLCEEKLEKWEGWSGELVGGVWCEGEERVCPWSRLERRSYGVSGWYEVSGETLWGLEGSELLKWKVDESPVRKVGEWWEYSPVSLGLDGKHVILSQWGPGSQLIDMTTNQANGIWMGSNYPVSGEIEDDKACMGGSDQSYECYNVSDWLHPIYAGGGLLSGNAIRLQLQGNYLWMLETGVGVDLYLIENMTNPVYLSSYLLTEASLTDMSILLSPNNRSYWIYVSTSDQGVYEIDYTDPQNPKSGRHWASNATSLYISGEILTWVDGNQASFYDLIHDKVTTFPDNGTHVRGAGGSVYTSGNGGLKIYNISTWTWTNLTFNQSGTYQVVLHSQEVGVDHHKLLLNQTTWTMTFEVRDSGYPEIGTLLSQQTGCCQVGVGELYNFTYAQDSFTNRYNETMTYELNFNPFGWLSLNGNSDLIHGTPLSVTNVGLWNVSMKVSNPKCGSQPNGSITETWTINVTGSLSVSHSWDTYLTYLNVTGIPSVIVITPSPWVGILMTLSPIQGRLNWTDVSGTTTYQSQILNTWIYNVSGPKDRVNVVLSNLKYVSDTWHLNQTGVNVSLEFQVLDQYQQSASFNLSLRPGKVSPPSPNSNGPNSKLGLILGASLGGTLGVIGLVSLVVLGYKGRQRYVNWKDDQILYDEPETKEEAKETKDVELSRISSHLVTRIKTNDLKLGKVLGKGGFGTVYKGIWRSGGDIIVAIKQMNEGSLMGALEQFEKEVMTMSQLRHPNIVQIYGISCDQTYAIIMEYMEGGALDNLLMSSEDLPWTLRRQILQDCWAGLSYLHQKNVMHRDVKSGNVLLTKDRHAKWTDFGISRSLGDQPETMTKGQGTVPWMAPEIIRGEKHYTKQADIYSYGILMWEMTTRRQPFEDKTTQFQLYEYVLKGGRPEIPPEMPDDLRRLMEACWDGDPERRPKMDEMLMMDASPRGVSPPGSELPVTPRISEVETETMPPPPVLPVLQVLRVMNQNQDESLSPPPPPPPPEMEEDEEIGENKAVGSGSSSSSSSSVSSSRSGVASMVPPLPPRI